MSTKELFIRYLILVPGVFVLAFGIKVYKRFIPIDKALQKLFK